MTIEENIKKLDINITEDPSPVGAYVAYKKDGNLVYISG